MQFIRIRSTMHEIMIAPDRDFQMIVIQDPANEGNTDDPKFGLKWAANSNHDRIVNNMVN